jgi:hypothetical protein
VRAPVHIVVCGGGGAALEAEMWNSIRSVKLSIVCTRIVMASIAGAALFASLPFGRQSLLSVYGDPAAMSAAEAVFILALHYACCVPAFAALLKLDRLLANIRRSQVFVPQNVKALRAISWHCFAEALILAVAGASLATIFFAPMLAAAFFGLILRVVKNVIDAAVELKTENDFTI